MANNTYTFVGSEIRPISGIEDSKILSAKYIYDDEYIKYNQDLSISNLHDIFLDLRYIIDNLTNRLSNLEGGVKYNIYLKDKLSGNINNNVNCTPQVIPLNYNGGIEIKAVNNNYYIIENGISSGDADITINKNTGLLASVTINNIKENESKSVNITVETTKVYADSITLSLKGSSYKVDDTFGYSIDYTPNVTGGVVHNDHKGVTFSFNPEGYIEFKNGNFNIIKGDKDKDNKTITITAKTTKNTEEKSDSKDITFSKKDNIITASDKTLTYNGNGINIGATVSSGGNLTYTISSTNGGSYISLSGNTITPLNATPSGAPVKITITGESTEKYKTPANKIISVTVNKADNPAKISKTGLNNNDSIESGGEFTITVENAIGNVNVSCENDGVTIVKDGNKFKISCPTVKTNTRITINVSISGDNNYNGISQDITATILVPSVKYYWYAGWTTPTEENIATIINEVNGKSGQYIGTQLGTYTKTSPLAIVDYYDTNYSHFTDKFYIVIPDGIKVYDSEGEATLEDIFDSTDITIPGHRVIISKEPNNTISCYLLR